MPKKIPPYYALPRSITKLLLWGLPAIIISAFLALSIVFAWEEPGEAPPGGNVPAPVNVGDITQYKSGTLGIGGVFRGYSTAIFDGNVGIGTTEPTIKLAIGDTDTGLQWISDNNLAVYTNNAERIRITSSGNVGIGTNNPGDKLSVQSSGAKTIYSYNSAAGGNAVYAEASGTSGNGIVAKGNNRGISAQGGHTGIFAEGDTYGINIGNSPIGINIGNSPIGINIGSGNWGINIGGDHVWAISIGGINTYGISIGGINTYGISATGDNIGVRGTSGSGNGVGVSGVNTSGANGVGVRGSGTKWDLEAVNGRLSWGSSVRWKKNIQPIDNALEKLMGLRGVSFDWDETHGGQRSIGLIAEEVGKVFPELVGYEENGKDATGMDYGRLTAVLVEAIKEQQKRIEALESEINLLKQER